MYRLGRHSYSKRQYFGPKPKPTGGGRGREERNPTSSQALYQMQYIRYMKGWRGNGEKYIYISFNVLPLSFFSITSTTSPACRLISEFSCFS